MEIRIRCGDRTAGVLSPHDHEALEKLRDPESHSQRESEISDLFRSAISLSRIFNSLFSNAVGTGISTVEYGTS